MEIRTLAFALLTGFAICQPVHAQQATLKAINDIKRSASAEGYLTEEKMVPQRDENTVESCAKGILRQLGGGYTLQDIKPYLHELVMNRGPRQLVFVYLKKSDLGTPSAAETSGETQFKVKPRFDIDANWRMVHQSPEGNHVSDNALVSTINAPTMPAEDKLQSIVKDIMLYKNAGSVRRSLEYMKAQGRIANYGLFKESSNLDKQYVVIFKNSRPYAPFAVLSPVQNGQRQNVETKEIDSVERYEGCGLMWFTVK